MWALSFEGEGHGVELPAIDAGLSAGLTVQVWVQRATTDAGQRLLELGDAERRIFLATHGAGGLCFGVEGGGATQTIAADALPVDTWVLVRATLAATGEATLAVHGIVVARGSLPAPTTRSLDSNVVGRGFVGRLARLRIWDRADAGGEDGLWAYYPLDSSDGEVRDASGSRHARASGPLRAEACVVPLADDAAPPVALQLFGGSIDAPPLRGPCGGLTVQMWIRADRVDVAQPLFEGVDEQTGARVTLSCGGADGLAVAVVIGGTTVLATAAQAVVAKTWTHVALHLDAAATATLVVDGRVLAEARRPEQASRLAQLLQADVIERVTFGSSATGATTFLGMIAEVRVLRGAAPAPAWLRRVRGDEARLAIAYAMDAIVAGAVTDRSPTCSHGQVTGDAAIATAPGLPLHHPGDLAQAHVLVRGALIREHLPLSLFPADEAWAPAAENSADRRAANAAAFGTVDGDRVLCSVYEAYLEPRHDADTPAAGETLEVCADAAVRVLVDDAETTTATTWPAGHVTRLEAPASGRLRVRVLAGASLQCPALRVRWAAMPGDLWTVVRPAEAAYARLAELDPDDLLTPEDGRASPLPDDATADDAEALAEALAALGAALPAAPAEEEVEEDELSFGLGKSLKKAGKSVKKGAKKATKKVDDAAKKAADEAKKQAEAAKKKAEEEARKAEAARKAAEEAAKKATTEAAKKAAEEAARQARAAEAAAKEAATRAAEAAAKEARRAGNFVVRGIAEAEALLEQASKLRPQTGVAAIRAAVADAQRLLVVPPELERGLRAVQIVGTRLVDGVESTFRVVVAGIEDAVAATEALLERIGAAIERFIEYLANLFAWTKFLAMSDRIYKAALRSYDRTAPELGRVASLPDTIGEWLARPVSPKLADKTLGSLLGVKLGKMPGFSELDDFMDKVQRLFSSKNRRTDKDDDDAATQDALGVDPDADTEAAVRSGGAALLPVKGDPLKYPIGPLLTTPAALWKACEPTLRSCCEGIAATATTTAKRGRSLLTGRIKVPWLTDLIETTILGGRKLDLLRIVALVAAIPAVLVDTIADEFVSFGGDEMDDDDVTALCWLSFGCSMANTLVSILRCAAERKRDVDLYAFSLCVQSVTTLLQSGANYALVTQLGGPASKSLAAVATTIDVAMAGWYFYMAYRLTGAFIGVHQEWARLDRLDMVIEVTGGAVQLVLIIIGVSLDRDVDDRLAATIAFRCGNMCFRSIERICIGLDKPTTPRRELATLGRQASNAMMLLIDIADGAYTASTA